VVGLGAVVVSSPPAGRLAIIILVTLLRAPLCMYATQHTSIRSVREAGVSSALSTTHPSYDNNESVGGVANDR
jgi:hypothetical protein